MEIKNVIFHKLNKEKKEKDIEQSPVTIDPRDTELDKDNELVKLLIDKIIESYKRGKTFGSFDTNTEIHKFQTWLKDFYDDSKELSFRDFTLTTMQSLKAEIENKNFATGGYILFCSYEQDGNQWFMIVMLKDKDGFTIEDLTLKTIQELDLDKLHQLVRINVSAWKSSDTKAYLSFINKKKGDASAYFVKVIGCTDSVPSKTATRAVFDLVDAVFEEAGSEYDEVSERVKETLYEFMDNRRPSPVNLDEIAVMINAELPVEFHDLFINLANSDQYMISEEFEPDLTELKRFKRIKYKTSLWVLDVERNAIGKLNSGANVIYNENDKSLTFMDLPDDLNLEILETISSIDKDDG
ncbi:nucleoid-associated protein [Methylophaga thalassica]|uniref:nucleoid-associated protein n=1 Tax=Methylophaga aminisulfidivorans TaxID=230105 RepID=UPI003A8C9070